MKTIIEYNPTLIHMDTEAVNPDPTAGQSLRYKRTLIHLWCTLHYPDANAREGTDAMAICVKVDDVIDPAQTEALHDKLLEDLEQIEGLHGMEWLKLRHNMQKNSKPEPESPAMDTELNLI